MYRTDIRLLYMKHKRLSHSLVNSLIPQCRNNSYMHKNNTPLMKVLYTYSQIKPEAIIPCTHIICEVCNLCIYVLCRIICLPTLKYNYLTKNTYNYHTRTSTGLVITTQREKKEKPVQLFSALFGLICRKVCAGLPH